MRNNYYFVRLDCEGTQVLKNVKVEKNQLRSDKETIENTWGCNVIEMKKTTKFNFDNYQY